jgi:flagellar hook assembly protein FlgD
VGDAVASTEPAEVRTGLALSVWPRPARGRCSLSLSTPRTGRLTARIHDVFGRTIRTLVDRAVPEGEVSLVWDCRDRSGHEVANGVYFVRVEVECEEGRALNAEEKVVVLR